MDGSYVGQLPTDDPLHDYLGKLLREELAQTSRSLTFRVFRFEGPHEVYRYQEKNSLVGVVCKFYGSRFAGDPYLAACVARLEAENLDTLRGYGLVGAPHHVVRPLGVEPDINAVLALEYYPGRDLTQAIRRATHHRDRAELFEQLRALAYFLAVQHNRTETTESVDFGFEADYFDTIVEAVLAAGWIETSDVEELGWRRDLWARRPRMWRDHQVWLHGDVTPSNFLFRDGLQVGAIDLERMRRGDRAFDVGRMAGELQHAFMVATTRKSLAEPFISYFFREYCRYLPDPVDALTQLTARTPFYMGLTHLRIARNAYLDETHRARLIRQAKRLLAFGGETS